MKKEEFLEELEDLLQREEPCNEGDNLDDYEEWDSLSKMSLMAYYSKTFGIKLSLDSFRNISTVADLIKLAGDKVSD